MYRNRTQLLNLSFVLASFGMVCALYGRLPQQVPVHWNLQGQADGFMAKPFGAFLPPTILAGIYLLLLFLPRISRRNLPIDRFKRTYEIIETSIIAFMFLANALALLEGIGLPTAMNRMIPAALGILFIVLGNFMGKIQRNFFVGLRTPWTLANDEVWLRTHRLGGKLFVLAGLVTFIEGLTSGGIVAMLVGLAAATIIPAIYSYLLYRKIEPGDREGKASHL